MILAKQAFGIRNFKEGKTLHVIETRSRDSETKSVGKLRVWFGKKGTVMEECTWAKDKKKGFRVKEFCVYIGRCWQQRRNKNPKTLSTDHSLF